MTTATQIQPSPTDAHETPEGVCTALGSLCEECRSRGKYYREALRIVAAHFGSPYAAIRASHSTSALDDHVSASDDDRALWQSPVDETLLQSQAENLPVTRLFAVDSTEVRAAVLSAPLHEHANRPVGALSLVVRCNHPKVAKLVMGELAALASLMGAHATAIGAQANPTVQDDSALKRSFVKAADFQSLDELAFAVTNSLKNKFSCDQVVLGQVRGVAVRILSLSGLDNVYPNSPGVKPIRQAMEECLDAGKAICCQDEDKWADESAASPYRLHRRWHEEVGNAPVASVPLMIGDKCVAVLGLTRSRQSPFSPRELDEIRDTVAPFAPAMALVAKADRGLFPHAVDALKAAAGWLLARRSYRRKAIAALVVSAFAWFCFASIGHEVTVPSRIAPTSIRLFAAPYQGTIRECYVQVGDRVAKGQPLYAMDTADLQLRRDALESEIAVLRLRVSQALAAEDLIASSLATAQLDVVRTELAITRHNLSAAKVLAPCDGTITHGQLSRRVGEVVPMGEPLMELVPEGDWSVELLVPETAIAELEVGFQGRFACNARPDESLDCRIARIRPSCEPRDGKNIVVAEASVVGNPAWMRTGMEGVAQIDAGPRRVWWVALHRVIDRVRMTFWM